MKRYCTILFIILLVSILFFLYTKKISEKNAFEMVFHNYDSDRKGAIWHQNDTPKYESFFSDDRDENGFVTTLLLESYIEDYKQKIVFITKTVPDGMRYDCHACYPQISLVIFSKKWFHWTIASQNLDAIHADEYGQDPIIRLIKVGRHKLGIEINSQYLGGELFEKFQSIFIPYGSTIEKAHEETVHHDNFNHCYCFACIGYTAAIHFDDSKKDTWYPMVIKRFGTIENDKKPSRADYLDETVEYHFKNGKYVSLKEKSDHETNYKALCDYSDSDSDQPDFQTDTDHQEDIEIHEDCTSNEKE